MREYHPATYVLSLLVALVLQLFVLPDALAGLRPAWVALTLAFWACKTPEVPVLIPAWLMGLCFDVIYDSPMGQYALGLAMVAFIVRRLAGFLDNVALWQQVLVLAPVWGLYEFLMFWIDGLTRHSADIQLRWLPVLSTTLVWPLVRWLLEGFRTRRSGGGVLP